MTKFLRTHPGGAKALRIFANRDASEQFTSYHSPAAFKKLELMSRGAPDAPKEAMVVSQGAIGRDFEAMRLEALRLYSEANARLASSKNAKTLVVPRGDEWLARLGVVLGADDAATPGARARSARA